MKESHYACKPLIYFARSHKLTGQFKALFDELEASCGIVVKAPALGIPVPALYAGTALSELVFYA